MILKSALKLTQKQHSVAFCNEACNYIPENHVQSYINAQASARFICRIYKLTKNDVFVSLFVIFEWFY